MNIPEVRNSIRRLGYTVSSKSIPGRDGVEVITVESPNYFAEFIITEEATSFFESRIERLPIFLENVKTAYLEWQSRNNLHEELPRVDSTTYTHYFA